MKKRILFMGAIALSAITFAQVGINTETPSATLDIVSSGDTNATKALEINNSAATEMVTVVDNGNVGIGDTTPESKLTVYDQRGTETLTSARYDTSLNTSILNAGYNLNGKNFNSVRNILTSNSTATTTGNLTVNGNELKANEGSYGYLIGLDVNVQSLTNTNVTNTIVGSAVHAYQGANSNVPILWGSYNTARVTGSGSVSTSATVNRNMLFMTNTGGITTANVIEAIVQKSGTGTIGTLNGLRINFNLLPAASVTGTAIGLNIDPVTQGATNYSIYSNGGNSYFKDNVGIGTTAPNADALLDVSSTTKGVKMPSVALTSLTSAAPLSAHVAGMMVYNTTNAYPLLPGIYANDGNSWIPLKTTGSTIFTDVSLNLTQTAPLTVAGTPVEWDITHHSNSGGLEGITFASGAITLKRGVYILEYHINIQNFTTLSQGYAPMLNIIAGSANHYNHFNPNAFVVDNNEKMGWKIFKRLFVEDSVTFKIGSGAIWGSGTADGTARITRIALQ